MGNLFRVHRTEYNPRTKKRERTLSKKWYYQIKVNGRFIREPAYTDKLASQAKMARRMVEIEREQEGIYDHFTQHLAAPLAEHLTAFRKHLADKGNTESYCDTTETRVKWICTTAGIEKISSITKSRVDAALAKLVDEGASVSSRNHYLTAIKGFAKWLVDERRAPDNPIAGMHKKSTKGEETKERRPLTDAEFAALLKAAVGRPAWDGISGPDRVALYILAAYTGFRRLELASLTPASFHLAGAEPYLELPTGKSKRRRLERLPLRADVAAYFRPWLAGKAGDLPLWPIENVRTAEMIQADLDAAEVVYKVDKVVVDFHALRNTFTTFMVKAGVLPKVAQKLARHSSIDLTMNTYAKLTNDDERAGIEMMPALKTVHKTVHKDRGFMGTQKNIKGHKRPSAMDLPAKMPVKRKPGKQGIKKGTPRKSGRS